MSDNPINAAKSKVQDVASALPAQAKEQVQHGVQFGKTQLHSVLTTQKNKAASAVTDIADAIKQSGATLKEQGKPGGATIAQSVGERIASLGTAVQDKDVEELLADTEAFAKARPVLYLTIATLLGVLLVRFLKSSSANINN